MAAFRAAIALAATALLLPACQLFSVSDACGPDGAYCVSSTTGGASGGITGGTNGGSATAGTTTSGVPTAPGAPTAVVAAAARDSAGLTWQAAPANGSAIIDYFVTVLSDGGLPDGGALDAGTGTTATVPGLTPGSSYSFSVVARNGIGVGPAGLSNAVVPFDLPGAPSSVTATAGQSSAVVTWMAPASNFSPITAYTVTSSPGSQSVTTDGTALSAMVTGLSNFTAYSFSVTATNAAGVGLPGSSNTVTPFPLVTTLAGSGDAGWMDGPGITAAFYYPLGIAVDAQGSLYVGDSNNNRVRKIAPDGTTSTLAGDGGYGFADGTGGPDGTTQFSDPAGVAVDRSGNVYVADGQNNRIRKIAPDGTTTTVAGNGDAGWMDGTADTVTFQNPLGVAVDADGGLYVADTENYRIRQVAADGTTSTLAGNGTSGWMDGTGGASGTASFVLPFGIAVGPQGNVFVGDYIGNRVRKVSPDGTTTTLAGDGDAGYIDGTGGADGTTQFSGAIGVAVDTHGFIYVADIENNRIRKIAPDGTTTTLAGDGDAGAADGPGGPTGAAQFYNPTGVAVDANGVVYVADYGNQRIRKIVQ